MGGGFVVLFGSRGNWEIGAWLGAIGVVISLGGFTTALLEIRKTQHAAKATRNAIDQTLRGVAASRLGVVIVQLRELAEHFEVAAKKGDSEAVRPALNNWRHHAADAKTLVSRRFGNDHDAVLLLGNSIESARLAKQSIFDGGIAADEATKQCLTNMEKALDGLGPLLEQLFPAADSPDESA